VALPRQMLQESDPTSLTDSAAWIGHKLGEDDRYEIKGLLGEGGMGTVFFARDQRMKREVVIKVPRC
jgi:serine/threonine protein kinase